MYIILFNIIITLYVTIRLSKTLYYYIKGVKKFKEIKLLNIDAIKLMNQNYKKSNSIFDIIIAIMILIAMYSRLGRYMFYNLPITIMLLIELVFCVVWILDDIIYIKYGKYSYITKSYIASIAGGFSKNKCKFVLSEKNNTDGKGELLVYTTNADSMYCFHIIERYDELNELIKVYYNK